MECTGADGKNENLLGMGLNLEWGALIKKWGD